MVLNRRIEKKDRRKIDKKISILRRPEIRQIGAYNPPHETKLTYAGIVGLGRRRWKNQKVWPKELERRTYDKTKVNLIGAKNVNLDKILVGDRVATTRRGIRHPPSSPGFTSNFPDRRQNKKLAKQITKASKTEAKTQKKKETNKDLGD